MDTTERKGDVIITRGDTVTNSGGWKRKERKKKRRGRGKKKKDRDRGRSADTQTHHGFKLNRKSAVISINCTQDWNAV